MYAQAKVGGLHETARLSHKHRFSYVKDCKDIELVCVVASNAKLQEKKEV